MEYLESLTHLFYVTRFQLRIRKYYNSLRLCACWSTVIDINLFFARKFMIITRDFIAYTFQVLHYVEKPETFISVTINCGVYLFSMHIFDHLKQAFERKQNTIKYAINSAYLISRGVDYAIYMCIPHSSD